jgi:Sulfate permease family
MAVALYEVAPTIIRAAGTKTDSTTRSIILRHIEVVRTKGEVVAGLTTAAVVIPKAMAYATIAGLPVQVGNHWNKMERPGVLLEKGHIVAITLAVIDVPKDDEKGNDGHGSKVIVIPFDGAALDRDL